MTTMTAGNFPSRCWMKVTRAGAPVEAGMYCLQVGTLKMKFIMALALTRGRISRWCGLLSLSVRGLGQAGKRGRGNGWFGKVVS